MPRAFFSVKRADDGRVGSRQFFDDSRNGGAMDADNSFGAKLLTTEAADAFAAVDLCTVMLDPDRRRRTNRLAFAAADAETAVDLWATGEHMGQNSCRRRVFCSPERNVVFRREFKIRDDKRRKIAEHI